MAMSTETTLGMVVGLTKTLYYRETDSKTGKQTWVTLHGVKSDGARLEISRGFWILGKDPFQVLYTKKKGV